MLTPLSFLFLLGQHNGANHRNQQQNGRYFKWQQVDCEQLVRQRGWGCLGHCRSGFKRGAGYFLRNQVGHFRNQGNSQGNRGQGFLPAKFSGDFFHTQQHDHEQEQHHDRATVNRHLRKRDEWRTKHQVSYHEPAKFVAKLRALKTNNNILILHTNMQSGHGGATGRFDALKETAFSVAFILNRVGIAE